MFLAAALALTCSVTTLAGCSSSGGTDTTETSQATDASTGAESTRGESTGAEPTGGGAQEVTSESEISTGAITETGAADAGCTDAKTAVSAMFVNWQIIIGMSRTPDVKLWANLPIGSLSQFSSQLDGMKAFIGGDELAAESISYMQGANEIVQRGLAGDTKASADLAAYLGTDLLKAVNKQNGISLALVAAGC